MDGVTLAVGVAVVLAIANVAVSGLLGWGLAGGDGEPVNAVAGVAALVTIVTAPVAAWQVMGLFPGVVRGALVVGAVVVAVAAVSWLSTHPDGPTWPVAGLLGMVAVGVPILLATTVQPAPVAWPQVVVATGPLLGLATALALVLAGREEAGEVDAGVLAAAASLVAVPAILAVLATA